MINWKKLNTSLDHYRVAFNNAPAFRHVVMDNFLEPEICREIGVGFETALAHKDHGAPKKHRDVLKKTGTSSLSLMTSTQVSLFTEIHSDRFVKYLEKLTGIFPLYADRELKGGGLHSSAKGGYLNVHTDFNFHPSTDNHRRLNLIIYLNKDWEEDWAGELELWNSDVTECVTKIKPIFNRAALFETSELSFHGHPVPLACPEGVTRKSLAVYYYSQWPDGVERRAKTNYVLTPWQKKQLQNEVELALAKGARTFEEVAGIASSWQSSHVKVVFEKLKNVRT